MAFAAAARKREEEKAQARKIDPMRPSLIEWDTPDPASDAGQQQAISAFAEAIAKQQEQQEQPDIPLSDEGVERLRVLIFNIYRWISV